MTTDCECIVIGAGVVGLAIAANLAQSGLEVVILEREASYGSITSARNSEVIHAGIYYAANSLKAQFCVAGKQALYRYCQDRHIRHEQCGKLIVATSESQVSELASIRAHAQANGVSDISLLSPKEARNMEADLSCLAALHSPSTGIIDSHGLMLNLLGDAQDQGAMLALQAPVVGIARLPSGEGYEVCVAGDNPMKLSCKFVVNAAGHGACEIAKQLKELPVGMCPEPILSKGNYFGLQGKSPFSRLIYPVPEVGGLGVHITIDLAGRARFGPDVEPVSDEEYSVDSNRSAGFYAAVRKYWPGLPDDSLTPDYAGIRPKISLKNSLYTDFLITSARDHGLPGLVNLFGIESPGLTSCLAIAEHVKHALQDSGL